MMEEEDRKENTEVDKETVENRGRMERWKDGVME